MQLLHNDGREPLLTVGEPLHVLTDDGRRISPEVATVEYQVSVGVHHEDSDRIELGQLSDGRIALVRRFIDRVRVDVYADRQELCRALFNEGDATCIVLLWDLQWVIPAPAAVAAFEGRADGAMADDGTFGPPSDGGYAGAVGAVDHGHEEEDRYDEGHDDGEPEGADGDGSDDGGDGDGDGDGGITYEGSSAGGMRVDRRHHGHDLNLAGEEELRLITDGGEELSFEIHDVHANRPLNDIARQRGRSHVVQTRDGLWLWVRQRDAEARVVAFPSRAELGRALWSAQFDDATALGALSQMGMLRFDDDDEDPDR